MNKRVHDFLVIVSFLRKSLFKRRFVPSLTRYVRLTFVFNPLYSYRISTYHTEIEHGGRHPELHPVRSRRYNQQTRRRGA